MILADIARLDQVEATLLEMSRNTSQGMQEEIKEILLRTFPAVLDDARQEGEEQVSSATAECSSCGVAIYHDDAYCGECYEK